MANIISDHVDELMKAYIEEHHLTAHDVYDGDIETDFNDLLDQHELPAQQWLPAVRSFISDQPDSDAMKADITRYAEMLDHQRGLIHTLYSAAEVIYAPQSYERLINAE
jgi:hypothetical protein